MKRGRSYISRRFNDKLRCGGSEVLDGGTGVDLAVGGYGWSGWWFGIGTNFGNTPSNRLPYGHTGEDGLTTGAFLKLNNGTENGTGSIIDRSNPRI